MDQWNRIETPEINSYLYGQLIFNQSVKTIQWGKNIFLNKWSWDNCLSICKQMNLEPYLTPFVKINSKWMKELNVRAKIIKLWEENIGVNLYDFGIGNSFSNMISKVRISRGRKINWTSIKIKNFRMSKDTIKQVKRQPTEKEQIFANPMPDKSLVFRIHIGL